MTTRTFHGTALITGPSFGIAPEVIVLDGRLPESLSYRNVQPDLELGCTGNIRRNSAFAQDVPPATVESLDTGHFALETHCDHIAARIRAVLGQPLPEGGK